MNIVIVNSHTHTTFMIKNEIRSFGVYSLKCTFVDHNHDDDHAVTVGHFSEQQHRSCIIIVSVPIVFHQHLCNIHLVIV